MSQPYTPDLFAAPTLTCNHVLQQLDAWVAAGPLRHLDAALARFLLELDPTASAVLPLATALLSHLEGRGHSCLPIPPFLANPQETLAWPAAAASELATLCQSLPDWQAALAASPVVGQGTALTPLVLDGQQLYLRRYWQHETRIASQIRERLTRRAEVDAATVHHWLDLLFAPRNGTDWQKIACTIALPRYFSIITGGPGTGKTYTVARLLALLFATSKDPQQLRIALAAPTGKAAARLKQSIDQAMAGLSEQLGSALPLTTLSERMGAARTLHSLLGARPDTRHFRHDASQPLEVDVLIVDEASMIHLEMMSALLDALPAHARLILLGDKDQLASVEAGAVLGDLCRDAEQGRYLATTQTEILAASGEILPEEQKGHGPQLAQSTVMLRESRRFGGPIGQLAKAVNAGESAVAQQWLRTPSPELDWQMHARQPALLDLAVTHYCAYLERVQSGPGDDHAHWARAILGEFEQFRLLCALRESDWGVSGINAALEMQLHAAKLIRKSGEWYAGRPVMVTRNDAGLGVFNGDIGVTLPAPDANTLRVYFLDGQELRSVLASRLPDAETAYAMTVHKSQGSEFAHTVLVLPEEINQVLTRELIYTGITRAKEKFTLITPRPGVFEAAIGQKTRRASGLAEKLDA